MFDTVFLVPFLVSIVIVVPLFLFSVLIRFRYRRVLLRVQFMFGSVGRVGRI